MKKNRTWKDYTVNAPVGGKLGRELILECRRRRLISLLPSVVHRRRLRKSAKRRKKCEYDDAPRALLPSTRRARIVYRASFVFSTSALTNIRCFRFSLDFFINLSINIGARVRSGVDRSTTVKSKFLMEDQHPFKMTLKFRSFCSTDNFLSDFLVFRM